MRTIFTSLLVIYAVDWLVSVVKTQQLHHRIRHPRHSHRRNLVDAYIYDGRSHQQASRAAHDERTIFERTSWAEEDYRDRESRPSKLNTPIRKARPFLDKLLHLGGLLTAELLVSAKAHMVRTSWIAFFTLLTLRRVSIHHFLSSVVSLFY